MPGDGAMTLLVLTGTRLSCDGLGPPRIVDAVCARAGAAAHSAQSPATTHIPRRMLSSSPPRGGLSPEHTECEGGGNTVGVQSCQRECPPPQHFRQNFSAVPRACHPSHGLSQCPCPPTARRPLP